MGYTREFYELHNGICPGEPEHGCKGGSEYYDHMMGLDKPSSRSYKWDYDDIVSYQETIERYRNY